MARRDRGLDFPAAGGSSARAKHHAALAQFGIAVALIGTMLALFLRQVSTYQELAERTAMEATVIQLRAGLRLRVAELLLRGREADIATLAGANPVGWLEPGLPNYAGEFESGQTGQVPAGAWYFVRDRAELRYRVMRTRNLAGVAGDPPELRFQVRGVIQENRPPPRIESATLVLLTPYRWY